MSVFSVVFFKLIPLYVIILLGFLAGKFLRASKETLASILIYILTPVVVFNGMLKIKISFDSLSLTIVCLLISCIMSLLFFYLGGFFWRDSTRNILAFTAGTGNTGYFGLPVAIALFGNDVVGMAVLFLLGCAVYENTLGFFITARGNAPARESLLRMLKLPALYAFLLGVVISSLDIHLGRIYEETALNFQSAYSVLGMMIVGLGLVGPHKMKFDLTFLSLAFIAKFFLWPISIAAVIVVDTKFLHLYSDLSHRVMILMSIVPMAANTVAYAALLNAQPEKASITVLLSTLFALFFIPLATALVL